MQRLRDHVSELEVEFVFWHATRAVGAGRSRRVANINEHAKCRSHSTAAVGRVLRCSFLGAHRLPGRAGKHHGQCDNSKKGNLVEGHGSKLCDAAVSRPDATLCGNSPLSLYLFPCRRTNKYDSAVP